MHQTNGMLADVYQEVVACMFKGPQDFEGQILLIRSHGEDIADFYRKNGHFGDLDLSGINKEIIRLILDHGADEARDFCETMKERQVDFWCICIDMENDKSSDFVMSNSEHPLNGEEEALQMASWENGVRLLDRP